MAVSAPNPAGEDQIHEIQKSTDRTQSDHELLERSMNCDRTAFSELAKRYFHIVYATALSILNSPEEAEDACQDGLIKAFRYIKTIRDPDKFGFWLRSIVRQESCSRLKKKSRTLTLLKKISTENQSDAVLIHSDKQRRLYHKQLLHHAVEHLSEKAREIVLLHYMSGLSCEEIAVQVGSRPGTIKSHLFKSRQKMLGYLSEIGVHSIEDI